MYDIISSICKMLELVLEYLPFFRQQRNFYGVNLAALHSPVVDECLKRPIVVGCRKNPHNFQQNKGHYSKLTLH